MAATWGANAWSDNSWASDLNTIDVNGISASFDLGQAQYVPVSGWGRSSWGNLSWNVNYSNINISLTGFSIPITLGDETTAGEINTGWGRATWGYNPWGIAGTLLANGIQMSSDIGSVSITNEINIGWGSDTWGYETWGASGLIVSPTGIEATFNIGTLGVEADASTGELTGEAMTITQGDEEAYIDFREIVSGIPMTMTLQYSEVVINAVGFGLTMQEGDETSDANTIATVSATSASTWNGNFAWGYGVWGNEPITNLAMSMQEGNVDPAPDAMVTGNAAAMFVGDETVTGDANTGTITPIKWGEQTWGQSTWGNGTYLSGASYSQAATISLGTAVGDANTIASITGQLMTMQEGDEGTTANARITATGIGLTMASGSVYNLIWNEVNTGTTSIWTEVDTAA